MAPSFAARQQKALLLLLLLQRVVHACFGVSVADRPTDSTISSRERERRGHTRARGDDDSMMEHGGPERRLGSSGEQGDTQHDVDRVDRSPTTERQERTLHTRTSSTEREQPSRSHQWERGSSFSLGGETSNQIKDTDAGDRGTTTAGNNSSNNNEEIFLWKMRLGRTSEEGKSTRQSGEGTKSLALRREKQRRKGDATDDPSRRRRGRRRRRPSQVVVQVSCGPSGHVVDEPRDTHWRDDDYHAELSLA
mmetsp:Transcript_27209/g.108960  ORF Transcript_27209/g.108960 Transcript_27209/m.108960 type:complete len:250 (-) Transcript_27209:110-859(-)